MIPRTTTRTGLILFLPSLQFFLPNLPRIGLVQHQDPADGSIDFLLQLSLMPAADLERWLRWQKMTGEHGFYVGV
jgi:hypothetical protein